VRGVHVKAMPLIRPSATFSRREKDGLLQHNIRREISPSSLTLPITMGWEPIEVRLGSSGVCVGRGFGGGFDDLFGQVRRAQLNKAIGKPAEKTSATKRDP